MRPVIALTCSTQPAPTNPAQLRDFAGQAYAAAVRRAGGAPLLVPPAEESGPVDAVLAHAHGLLLTGGVDLAPEVYGEPRLPECGEVYLPRDALDRWFLDAADRLGLPVLGICRGVQAVAAFRGGSLYQDLASQVPGALTHQQSGPRSELTHTVEVAAGSQLAEIVGRSSLVVNSFHHQAVKQPPVGFAITARAPDGVIEGLEATDGRWWVGVQWHPEDLAAEHPRHQALFGALVEAARRRAAEGPGRRGA